MTKNIRIMSPDDDIFQSPHYTLINAVNCVGVMGAGLAGQFRKRMDENYYSDYQWACSQGYLGPGNLNVYDGKLDGTRSVRVINFPTMNQPGEKSSEYMIHMGLVGLYYLMLDYEIPVVTMPALGCGIGRFSFERLRELTTAIFAPPLARTTLCVDLYPPK